MLHARKSYNERIQDSAGNIPMDEPVFLLRGQDKLAAALLDIYVVMTRNTEGYDTDIAEAVEEHAQRMREWPLKKVADMSHEDHI